MTHLITVSSRPKYKRLSPIFETKNVVSKEEWIGIWIFGCYAAWELQYVPYVLQHNKESIVYATNWKQKDKGTKPLIHEKYSNDNYAITLTKPLILQHWQVMYVAPTNIEIQHNHWLTLPIIKYSSYTELIQFPCNQKS